MKFGRSGLLDAVALVKKIWRGSLSQSIICHNFTDIPFWSDLVQKWNFVEPVWKCLFQKYFYLSMLFIKNLNVY